ncbi:MAG: antibiotic biosynthesis monooxygenase [Bryobacterales bacterium]|nr:antibiotic biosynthesis monooxygenase [Bryobacterales bacterium]
MRHSLLKLILLLSAATLAAFGQDGKLYVVTHIDAEPNFTADAKSLLRGFASDSRKDPGAVRIEILEENGKPNHFTVVEVWQNQKDYESHLATAHTKAFRAKLLPMLGSPFDERLHSAVQ